jgi:gliding motility-associated-like protein
MSMKNRCLIFIFLVLCKISCYSQAGEWTWMGGSMYGVSSPGNYGTQGIASPANVPPGIYEGFYWTDLQGNFWIFGGVSGSSNVYNNLWKYNVAAGMWTWMKGSGGVYDQPGIYGTQGIPSISNNPGARGWGGSAWTDNAGDLWLYGGGGIDAYGVFGGLTDLWRYHIATNEWTWMKGNNTVWQPGSYGVQTVEDPANLPPLRSETNAAWTDLTGNLWLFGGADSSVDGYDDLWKYNVSTNNFVWMRGTGLPGQPAVYGTLGYPSSSNTPGGRLVYTRSVDSNGDLWLFGGCSEAWVCGTDIWKYSVLTNQWTWMDGPNLLMTVPGHYGSYCDTSQLDQPDFKYENRACWSYKCGNFINFGGLTGIVQGYNDLWVYDVIHLRWTRMDGTSTYGTPGTTGNYGTLGVMSPANKVPVRGGSCSFTDTAGNLWLFGGYGTFNDLWKYTITDTSCMPRNCDGAPVFPPPVTTPPPAGPELFIPNVFSPNSDGDNNLFTIKANGFTTFHLQIYNRWGQKVFESDDAQKHWDGKLNNNGEASEGTYYYILYLTDAHNRETFYKGFLTLLR